MDWKKRFNEKFIHTIKPTVKKPCSVQIDFGKYLIFDDKGNIEQANVGELSLDIKAFIQSLLEDLAKDITDDKSLEDESNGRYNREIELRNKLKKLGLLN